jgi:hypothetical protein
MDGDYLTADGQQYRMSAEMRRGSVGASYNLHAKKKSLLVDRHPAYLSQNLTHESIFRKSEKQRSPLALDDSNKVKNIDNTLTLLYNAKRYILILRELGAKGL